MADRKKIALCLEYPIAFRGGVSVLVETLLEGLQARYDVMLVSPDQAEELKTSLVAKKISAHIQWNPRTVSPQTSRALAESLSRQGCQLAHFHSGGNFGWGMRFPGHSPLPYVNQLGIPVFSTVHSVVSILDGFCGPKKPLWFKLAMLPLAWLGKMHTLAHVQKEIAVSQHDLKKLRCWYAPLRGKFSQIYHSRLHAQSQPPELASRDPIVLNVGHVAQRKGQGVLAEAFAEIAAQFPQWKLWIAGDVLEDSAAEKINEIKRRSGLAERIVLLGARADAMDLMRCAGVYAQPSNEEALGLALQEALFVGCPAVGTRVGGIPELIDDGQTGLLVDKGDVAGMAQALARLMSNPGLRAEYGKRGAASILEKGMTAEQMVAHHVELYEKVFRGS